MNSALRQLKAEILDKDAIYKKDIITTKEQHDIFNKNDNTDL
jgi:hypothetical protein